MKQKWLYVGLGILLIGLTNIFLYRLIIALCILIFLYFVVDKKTLKIICLCFSAFLLLSVPLKINVSKGRVKEIKNGYIIVGNLFSNVLVYTESEACLDDYVQIEGSINDISVNSNFQNVDYKDYCKGNKIIGILYQTELEVKNGFSIRRLLYKHNIKVGNEWINQVLFGCNLDTESNLKYLVVSSGMHISCFFMIIKKILGKYFYPDTNEKIILGIEILFGIVFYFPFGCIRNILGSTLRIYVKDTRDKTGLYIFILALLKPYNCLSVEYLLPCLIRLLYCFSNQLNKLKGMLLVIFIQLFIRGYCDLVSCLLFSLFRYCFTLLYIFSLLCVFSPLKIPIDLNRLLEIIDYQEVYLSGQINTILFIVLVVLLLNNVKKNVLILSIILLFNNYRCLINPFYSITYLDVGQADCAAIQLPFSSHSLLIDTAGNNYSNTGKSIVLPYLLRNGIKSADIIISHYDSDHSGNLEYLVNNFKVNNIYDQKCDSIYINDLVVLNLVEKEYEDENDNSLVCYFKINDFGFLFLGDISKIVELDLVQEYGLLDVDVCKMAHHGSKTASSDTLLSTYQIRYALISCGKENTYHHPHYEVSKRINDYGSKMLVTNQLGAIRFIVFKNRLLYITSNGILGL